MKISYDLREHYWKYYNEAQGIMANRNKAMTHKPMQYKTILFLYFAVYFLFTFEYYFMFQKDSSNFALFFNEFYKIFHYLFIILIVLQIIVYLYNKKKQSRGELLIDQYGITDDVKNRARYGLPWSKIKALIITKNTCTFVTTTFVFFFAPRSLETKIISAIKKYNKDLDIISYTD